MACIALIHFIDSLCAKMATTGDTMTLLGSLRSLLRGELITRDDQESFDAQRFRSWNRDLSVRALPLGFVIVSGVHDIVTAVKFCSENEITVSVRGKGAHSPWGLAQDALCIDLSRMDSVWVDPQKKIAHVQAGALVGDVDHETFLYNLVTPLGTVSHTGFAGVALGGGISHLSRWLGATVDNFVEIELVKSDGRVVRVNETSDPELFWAMRGNGFNFGIVTEVTVKLHEFTNNGIVRGGPIAFPESKVSEVMVQWLKHISEPGRKVTETVQFGCIPTPDGATVSALIPCLVGGTEEGRKAYCDELATFGEGAIDRMDTELPFAAFQQDLDDALPHNLGYYEKGMFLNYDANDDAAMKKIASLSQQAWNDRPYWSLGKEGGSTPFFILCLDVGEGNMGKVNPATTSFSARSGRVWFVLIASWNGVGEEFVTKAAGARAWVRKWHRHLEPFKITGGYANDYLDFRPDVDNEDMKLVYPGDAWQRLQALKAHHDPSSMFKATSLKMSEAADLKTPSELLLASQ